MVAVLGKSKEHPGPFLHRHHFRSMGGPVHPRVHLGVPRQPSPRRGELLAVHLSVLRRPAIHLRAFTSASPDGAAFCCAFTSASPSTRASLPLRGRLRPPRRGLLTSASPMRLAAALVPGVITYRPPGR